ncbi:MAG: PilZ domain-containing protein [Acidobacteria bacterium]|nr:PilZ domain-containing protein [Acidobacteriota bacterium]
MADKRTSRRVPLVIRVEAQAGGSPHILLAQNISVGGILLRTAGSMEEGESFDLKFILPGEEVEIQVTGRVQHVTPGQFAGVEFTNLGPGDADAIRRFVEKA